MYWFFKVFPHFHRFQQNLNFQNLHILILYETRFTIYCIQGYKIHHFSCGKVFFSSFFIEPVDNFWYTYDSNVYSHVPQVSQRTKLCYPQTVYNYVDNFLKLCNSLLKQVDSHPKKAAETRHFPPVGILWTGNLSNLCINHRPDEKIRCFQQHWRKNLWITFHRKTQQTEKIKLR